MPGQAARGRLRGDKSSNDVIPTVIQVAAAQELQHLTGALRSLRDAIDVRARAYGSGVKTARTRPMDAVPMTLGQELSRWAAQVEADLARLADSSRGFSSSSRAARR